MANETVEYKLIEALHNKIQEQINSFTPDGWRVVNITAGGPAGLMIFVLLERRKS